MVQERRYKIMESKLRKTVRAIRIEKILFGVTIARYL